MEGGRHLLSVMPTRRWFPLYRAVFRGGSFVECPGRAAGKTSSFSPVAGNDDNKSAVFVACGASFFRVFVRDSSGGCLVLAKEWLKGRQHWELLWGQQKGYRSKQLGDGAVT